MASTQVQREGVAQVAGRILIAWRNGESAILRQELEDARFLASQTAEAGTFEMERLEALSGAVESLREGRQQSGAVRLLEHLAEVGARPALRMAEVSLWEAGFSRQ